MSYRNPQLNVRSDAALYTNFFNSISSSFNKYAETVINAKEKTAELIDANKKANDKIDDKVATYISKVEAGLIKADTSTAIDLVESYKPVLAQLRANKDAELKGTATEEEKAAFRDYEIKSFQSIALAQKGLKIMVQNGQELVDSKNDGTFDNDLNDPQKVLGFQMINKGGVNKLVIDAENPANINWVVSSKAEKDQPGQEIYRYNMQSMIAIEDSPGAEYWVTTPTLDYKGVGDTVMDAKGNFNEGILTKEDFSLIKENKGEKTYLVTENLDVEAMRGQNGSTVNAQIKAKAAGILEYPNQAASLWNKNLSNINGQVKWANPIKGEPLSNEQKAMFTEAYIDAFYKGLAKTYSKKVRTVVNPRIDDGKTKPKPGKPAAALLAKIKSLESGQVGSFFEFKGKTVKQTGENEWTLTEEVVASDGSTSTKVIAKVDDPNKLKDKFGISDAALVPEKAELDVDMAVDFALPPITEEDE